MNTPPPHLLPRALALPPPCRTLLVAPCGDGELCLHLADLGLQVTGIDRDERRIARARERTVEVRRQVSFQIANVLQMSFADRHFDAVLCLDLYPWTTDEAERWRLVAELCRVARRYVLLGHLFPYAVGAWLARLRVAGSTAPGAWRGSSATSLREKFARYGFRPLAEHAQGAWLRPQRISVFQRN